jgi:hypothetical protein
MLSYCYADCSFFVVMLNVIKLSVAMHSIVMLSVIMHRVNVLCLAFYTETQRIVCLMSLC